MSFFRVIVRLFHFNRTNWKAVTLCFFGAIIFWVFNSLNKTYSANIRFPVSFNFDQQKYSSAQPLPEAVVMNVSGLGWDLLRNNFGMKLPVLEIPIERPLETKRISGSTLHGLLAGQVGLLQINLVVTDTLYFKIEPRYIRKFGLTINLDEVSFKDGYGITGFPMAIPDSVLLEGPESIINSISETIPINVSGKRIDADQIDEIEVMVEQVDLVKRDPPVVQVRYEVGRVENISMKVRVKYDSLEKGIGADSTSCTFSIPVQFIKRPGELFTHIHGLVSSAKRNTKVLPDMVGLPPFVKVVHVDSVQID